MENEKKLNQEEVAELLGVKNPYLSGMTNGKYPVTENVLRKISEIFGSIHQILPLICSLR
jgi:transcriptional regulator with XRE-family HTH domain